MLAAVDLRLNAPISHRHRVIVEAVDVDIDAIHAFRHARDDVPPHAADKPVTKLPEMKMILRCRVIRARMRQEFVRGTATSQARR